MNIAELKDYMNRVIMKQLDHKNIDQDVAYFKNHVSTTENVAIFIWDSLKTIMLRPELLYEIKIYETDKNSVRYRGKNRHRNGVANGRERRLSENIIANLSSDSDS